MFLILFDLENTDYRDYIGIPYLIDPVSRGYKDDIGSLFLIDPASRGCKDNTETPFRPDSASRGCRDNIENLLLTDLENTDYRGYTESCFQSRDNNLKTATNWSRVLRIQLRAAVFSFYLPPNLF